MVFYRNAPSRNTAPVFQRHLRFQMKTSTTENSVTEHCSFLKWWHANTCELFWTECVLHGSTGCACLLPRQFVLSFPPHCTQPLHKTEQSNTQLTLFAFSPLEKGNFQGSKLTCNLSPNESLWMMWVMSGFWGCALALCVDTWKLPGT